MKISFLGDVSLNDDYIKLYQNKVNPFTAIESCFSDSDYVVGNLECMVKGDFGENELKKPRLGTTIETLNFLKTIRLDVACLAQNHAYDFLSDGFIKTTDFLRFNGIKYLGAGLKKSEANKHLVLTDGNIKIALLNYITEDTNPNLPGNSDLILNIFELNKCKNDILTIKETVDQIVVLLHWGGRVEGGLFPDLVQPKISRAIIDSGADIIIGHHSHTVQPYEIYKGKYIFYSLGNFCFSDYTFENTFNPMSKRRRISFIVDLQFSKKSYNVKMHYFKNKLYNFVKIPNYKFKHKFRNFIFHIMRIVWPLWYIYFFFFKFVLPVVLFYQRHDLSFNQKNTRLLKSLVTKISF